MSVTIEQHAAKLIFKKIFSCPKLISAACRHVQLGLITKENLSRIFIQLKYLHDKFSKNNFSYARLFPRHPLIVPRRSLECQANKVPQSDRLHCGLVLFPVILHSELPAGTQFYSEPLIILRSC